MACPSTRSSQACNDGPCPVHCKVGAFSAWSKCSKPCGGGTATRTRAVVALARHGGYVCPFLSESKPCHLYPCPVDCGVGAWRSWSTCSETCGGGTQKRSRTNAQPEFGGKSCPHSVETQRCAAQACPPPPTPAPTPKPTPYFPKTKEAPFAPGSCPSCETYAGQILLRVDTRIASHSASWRCHANQGHTCSCVCPHPDAARRAGRCQEIVAFGLRRAVAHNCTDNGGVSTSAGSKKSPGTSTQAGWMSNLFKF